METVKHVHAIEYRNKTEPPTEEGWYWARGLHVHEINPVRVIFVASWTPPLSVEVAGSELTFRIQDFEWFGPVAECREG